jgi:hypothetical protein
MLKTVATLFIAPIIRAALQMFAGSEVIDEDTQSKVVGAAVFIGTVLWSIYEKKSSNKPVGDNGA